MKPFKNNNETVFAIDNDYCEYYTIPLALKLVKKNKKIFTMQELNHIIDDIRKNKFISYQFKQKAISDLKPKKL